jgi:limonene 1,2-monooxygenase
VTKLRESQKYLIDNRAVFERAQQAIMAKIMQNDAAAEALKHTKSPRFAAASAALPDLEKAKAKAK